ncbi:MAG: MFS transporter [Anaerolineae bacterium]|nr:MFS transporter [Anaerolineae bacterium]
MHSRAYRVYIVSELLMSLLLSTIFAASTLFRIQIVQMTPLQLVLIGTALEASAFLFEIPTGIVADSYSRKLSVILGIGTLGLSCALSGLFPIFWVQIVLQIVAGLGYTFISGAQQAWITDEIGEEAAAKAFMRSSQLGAFGSLTGIITTILLGSINIAIPIVLGGVLMVALAVVMFFVMPEQGFKPTPKGERSTFQHMAGTFKGGLKVVRGNRILVTILLLSAIMGAWSESYDRMGEIHFINTIGLPSMFQPVVWFGLMGIVGMPIHLIVTEIARRRLKTDNHQRVVRILMSLEILLIISAVTFALAGNLLVAYIASLIIGLVRSVGGPIRMAWLNQHVPSEVRATVISMDSQANAIGQIAGGPIFGAVGNYSLRAALTLGAVLLAPGQWLYWRSLKEDITVSPEVVEAVAAEA